MKRLVIAAAVFAALFASSVASGQIVSVADPIDDSPSSDSTIINVIVEEEDREIDMETGFPVDFFGGAAVDVEVFDFNTLEYSISTLTASSDGIVIVDTVFASNLTEQLGVLDVANDQFEILSSDVFIPISTTGMVSSSQNANILKLLLKVASQVFKKAPKKKLPIPKVGGLKKQLDAHKKKLADYIKDPDKFDNKGFLKGASPETRRKIVEGRIKNLEKQIKNFQDQIDNAGG